MITNSYLLLFNLFGNGKDGEEGVRKLVRRKGKWSISDGGLMVCANPISYARWKEDKYDPLRRFAAWYMRSNHAFISYYYVFDYGLRYKAKKFGKLTRNQ